MNILPDPHHLHAPMWFQAAFVPILSAVIASSAGLFAAGFSEEGDHAGRGTPDPIHVYSHRHYDTDRALYHQFEEETGIPVRVVEAGADELIQRLIAERSATEADLLITVDAGRLYRASEADILQPIGSDKIVEQIPEHLRDPQGEWVPLTIRARVIAYHRDRGDPSSLSSYEALAEPRYEGTVAIRSSSNIYNISLLASLVANLGEERAHAWADGMTRSFARPPQGNDRDQLRAIAAGDADYAVVNTYYLGRMITSSVAADREVAEQIGVYFPNQPGVPGSDGRGTHINVSGAGITKHADNVEGARRLLQFLLSDEAQTRFAAENFEYPIRENVERAPEVSAWGEFVADDLPLRALGEYADEASVIFDRVGWR